MVGLANERGLAPRLSEELRAARRALEDVACVDVLRDWVWDRGSGRWALHCRLSPGVAESSLVPRVTDWYVLADVRYPWGEIAFYPAKERGLVTTFPHQDYNGTTVGNSAWCLGKLCLDTSVRVLGRFGDDEEPYDAHARLKWRFGRALRWLEAASRDALILPGEPFELPQFPFRSSTIVGHADDADSFAIWQREPDRVGGLELARVSRDAYAATLFRSASGRKIYRPAWGSAVRDAGKEPICGIWVRLDTAPTLPPWQAPSTWGELRAVARVQGIAIDDFLKTVVGGLRDGRPHVALIGFPIPAMQGERPSRMHWQAMILPALSYGTQRPNGYRPNEVGYWERDRRFVLREEERLEWAISENWHAEQLTSRGSLPQGMTQKRVLILGVGALGSAVAELLVRAGQYRVTLMDADTTGMGNLVRHTLVMQDVGWPKAEVVAARLNALSPHAEVVAVAEHFPPRETPASERIQDADVVVDCTSSDAALHDLAEFPWGGAKIFASFSFGINARRLYCFTARGERFPHAAFEALVSPWLLKERTEFAGLEFPQEGIGCWHPVFPARADDIWLWASVAVKQLVAYTEHVGPTGLAVFAQREQDGAFAGVERVDNLAA